MKYLVSLVLVCCAVLSACGDDSSSSVESVEIESSSSEKSSDTYDLSSSSTGSDLVLSSSLESDLSPSSSAESTEIESSLSVESSEARESSLSSGVSDSGSELSSNSSEANVVYDVAKVKPSGTYDCSKYKCITTEYLNQDLLKKGDYGEVLDERDNQVYRTIQINDQVWMAQNLNFETDGGFCNTADADCAKYGRYDVWWGAVDRKDCAYGNYCALSGVQGLCPTGWHIPSKQDWSRLFDNVGVYGNANSNVAPELRAHTGWSVGNEADEYGFSALPSGYKGGTGGSFDNEGTVMYAWTSTETGEKGAYHLRVYGDKSWYSLIEDGKSLVLPVRCLMDSKKDTVSSCSYENPFNTCAPSLEGADEWLDVVSRDDYLNPSIEYDSLVDSRDGQVYKTRRIGKMVWMVQNLNYADSAKTPSLANGSWCFRDDAAYCKVLGRLYNWDAAQDVCPEGWHLPSSGEWKELESKFGGQTAAGQYLKSQAGWRGRNGSDEFGFSAIPAGGRYINEFDNDKVNYNYLGQEAFYWSSSDYSEYMGYRMNISYSDDYTNVGTYNKIYAFSVRCVRN
ncbi:FISUMP domain-containing protein [uncultured Fibrobacter sp.]|uniref:FISUMP domain-containing protein n=1 Tax=uncultured Fibrobacter sp. TaxID=261512 RepID=UPI0025E66323|nr:FISUMP domain-containing protein [uncultured Fibrobacter sp.]